jgi:menaquinone-9 beta-reductase
VEVRTEVAIIGAGPAGSTLAALLASRGVSVALIDRDVFPRDKVCGEFLSYDALPIVDRLGIAEEIDRIAAPAIDRCRVIGRQRTYEFALPEPARGISRYQFDTLLFRRALVCGARAWSGWTATTIDPVKRRVSLDRQDERATIRADVIIGAWGRWGRFDTQLERAFVKDRAHRSFGFKRHYRTPAAASHTIDLYSFRRGYLGVSPIEDGMTNICGLVHGKRLTGHRGKWESFIAMLRSEEPQLEALYASHKAAQESFLTSEPVIFRARSAVEQGVIMIGDASGVIDPLTGNGMAMALQSAALAVPFVRDVLAKKAEADAYRQAHAEFFAPRIRWSRRVAMILSRPRLLEASLRLVRSPRAGEFFLGATRAQPAALQRLIEDSF